MFNVVDSRGFNLVPDASPLAQGIGSLINQKISESLKEKAMGGDEGALASLASRDPRMAAQLGALMEDKRQQQALAQRQQQEQQTRQRDLIGKFAKGYQTARDKKGYLAAGIQQFNQFGFPDLAKMIQEDLDVYNANPAQVDSEYTSILSTFGDTSSQLPAEAQAFEYLTQGFSPEEKNEAKRVKAGISQRATAPKSVIIGGVPHVFDPNTGEYMSAKSGGSQITADTVAAGKATIAGAETKAKEDAKMAASGKAEDREKMMGKQAEMAREAVVLAREIANSPDLESISGVSRNISGRLPSNQDLVLKAKRLESILTVDNLKLMSGVLTDKDITFLTNIASGLGLDDLGFKGTGKGAAARLNDIANKIESGLSNAGAPPASIAAPAEQSAAGAQPAKKRFVYNPATGRLE